MKRLHKHVMKVTILTTCKPSPALPFSGHLGDLARPLQLNVQGKLDMLLCPSCCTHLLHRSTLFQLVQVKETIMTSALLRLPLSISRKEKMQRVSDIIAQLVRHLDTHAAVQADDTLAAEQNEEKGVNQDGHRLVR